MDFLELLKSRRRELSLAFACLVLANLLGLAMPWSIKLILDEVLAQGKHRLLLPVLGSLAAVIFLRAFAAYGGSFLGMRLAEQAAADLREKLYRHLLKLSVLHMETVPTGALLSKVVGDVETVKQFLLSGVLDFFYSILSACFVLAVLLWMDWRLAAAAILFLPVFVLTYSRLSGRFEEKHKNLRKAHGDLSARLAETFRGIRTVHAFGRQDYEAVRFAEKQEDILETAFQTHAIDARLWAAVEFLTSLGLILLLGLGARRVLAGGMTVGTLMAFYAYAGLLFIPLMRLATICGAYGPARASMNRIRGVFREWPEPVESDKAVSPKTIKGNVEFHDVSFSYDGQRPAVAGISFKVNAGDVVALVGPSGSGKTTLISLLARFFDPCSGRILVDGHNLRELGIKNYRSKIAFVLQNDFLFSGTVRQNILYGNLDAEDEAVEQAARAANIHDFILNLPRQYETQIGEGGVNLSGGERQKITIARAVLRDPAILVLDEATSAVDVLGENRIAEALRRLMKGRTTFIIAHHPSAVMRADKVVRIEKGSIVHV